MKKGLPAGCCDRAKKSEENSNRRSKGGKREAGPGRGNRFFNRVAKKKTGKCPSDATLKGGKKKESSANGVRREGEEKRDGL